MLVLDSHSPRNGGDYFPPGIYGLDLSDDAQIRVILNCLHYVMTTLPQSDLPLPPGILRTAARHDNQELGDFGVLQCVI